MLEMYVEIIFQKNRPPDTLLVLPQEALLTISTILHVAPHIVWLHGNEADQFFHVTS